MAWFRSPRLLKRRADGTFELRLDADGREVLALLLGQLQQQVAEHPDDPSLYRLQPTAYMHDPDADAAYRLLAGEELRASREAAIEIVLASASKDRLTEDELWAWLRALNAVRLVAGTRLDISDDDPPRPDLDALDDATRSLWAVYEWTTALQAEVVLALQG
ncbi:MAG: DUF2017 family protein [Acidimicrobiales bacterium]